MKSFEDYMQSLGFNFIDVTNKGTNMKTFKENVEVVKNLVYQEFGIGGSAEEINEALQSISDEHGMALARIQDLEFDRQRAWDNSIKWKSIAEKMAVVLKNIHGNAAASMGFMEIVNEAERGLAEYGGGE